MKKWAILTSLVIAGNVQSDCQQAHRKHRDKNIVRCCYNKNDIRKHAERNPDRGNRETCFYCGCKTEKHSE